MKLSGDVRCIECGTRKSIMYTATRISLPRGWAPFTPLDKLGARCNFCIKGLPLLTVADCQNLGKAAAACHTLVLSADDYLALRKINFNPHQRLRVHLDHRIPVSIVLLGSKLVYDGDLVGEWRELRGLKPVDARWRLTDDA